MRNIIRSLCSKLTHLDLKHCIICGAEDDPGKLSLAQGYVGEHQITVTVHAECFAAEADRVSA